MRVDIGASGYAYKEWKGKFYPGKIPAKDMLAYYSQKLRAVEINSTFYRMPTEKVLSTWVEQVPDDFVFAVKAPQRITHIKRLHNVEEEIDYLFSTLSVMGTKLGPILFLVPKSLRADLPALKDMLNLVPPNAQCAFAFRNPTWVDDTVLALLHERRCGLCLEDTDDSPALTLFSTAAWGYLRLRGTDYSDDDLKRWAEGIVSRGWDRAYVFFKHEDEAKAPRMALQFCELVDSIGGPGTCGTPPDARGDAV